MASNSQQLHLRKRSSFESYRYIYPGETHSRPVSPNEIISDQIQSSAQFISIPLASNDEELAELQNSSAATTGRQYSGGPSENFAFLPSRRQTGLGENNIVYSRGEDTGSLEIEKHERTHNAGKIRNPIWLHRGTLLFFGVLFGLLAIATGLLYRISEKHSGLRNDVESHHYSWKYGPTLGMEVSSFTLPTFTYSTSPDSSYHPGQPLANG
jgi:hypothetical protein